MDICRQIDPEICEIAPGRFVACHLHDQDTQKTAVRAAEFTEV
jgi:oligopeptide transport system ATP-binding protein